MSDQKQGRCHSNESKNPEVSCCAEAQVCETPETVEERLTHQPYVDIRETDSAVYLTVDMPGVDENHLDLTVDKNVLTIVGKTSTPDYEGYELAYGEYADGDYQRTFRLSDTLDVTKIDATINQGVLLVTLPKVEEVQPQKITVKAV